MVITLKLNLLHGVGSLVLFAKFSYHPQDVLRSALFFIVRDEIFTAMKIMTWMSSPAFR